MLKSLLFSICVFFSILSQKAFAEEEVVANKNSFLQPALMIGLALVFFYFILWRPEQKRRKNMENKRNSIAQGDKVTAMGIVGTVEKVNEQSVILKMVEGAKIEVLKAAITDIMKPANATCKEDSNNQASCCKKE